MGMKIHCLYATCLLTMLVFSGCQKADVTEPECGTDSIQAL